MKRRDSVFGVRGLLAGVDKQKIEIDVLDGMRLRLVGNRAVPMLTEEAEPQTVCGCECT